MVLSPWLPGQLFPLGFRAPPSCKPPCFHLDQEHGSTPITLVSHWWCWLSHHLDLCSSLLCCPHTLSLSDWILLPCEFRRPHFSAWAPIKCPRSSFPVKREPRAIENKENVFSFFYCKWRSEKSFLAFDCQLSSSSPWMLKQVTLATCCLLRLYIRFWVIKYLQPVCLGFYSVDVQEKCQLNLNNVRDRKLIKFHLFFMTNDFFDSRRKLQAVSKF